MIFPDNPDEPQFYDKASFVDFTLSSCSGSDEKPSIQPSMLGIDSIVDPSNSTQCLFDEGWGDPVLDFEASDHLFYQNTPSNGSHSMSNSLVPFHPPAMDRTMPPSRASKARCCTLASSERGIEQPSESADHGRWSCLDCPEIFGKALLLDAHAKDSRHRPFKCVDCSKTYRRQSTLARHRAVTHGPGAIHACKICTKPKSFRRKDHLQQHLREVHCRFDYTERDAGS